MIKLPKLPFFTSPLSDQQYRRQHDRIVRKTPIPVFWLFGKTGSGKTSIVKYLTGAADAEIGNGFRPQTQRSQQYDFPSSDSPLLRFLDTRGLGEARYDPDEDLRQFAETTHVQVVTVKVLDHAVADVIAPLRKIREAQPGRPVVLALTCLHEAYPHQQHPAAELLDVDLLEWDLLAAGQLSDALPLDLRRSISGHVERFAGLVDRIVCIDLTKPEEGFEQPDYRGDRLKAALVELLPAVYQQVLVRLDEVLQPLKDLNQRRAMPYVISYSAMAATAAAVPMPWVDIPVVMATQSHMVYQLARLYDQPLRTSTVLNMLGAVGGRVLARMIVREGLKVIPFLGMAANSALAYAYTFGLGKACCWYYGELCQGNSPSQAELRQVWNREISLASQLWKKQTSTEHDS